jgi:hypothetical protein
MNSRADPLARRPRTFSRSCFDMGCSSRPSKPGVEGSSPSGRVTSFGRGRAAAVLRHASSRFARRQRERVLPGAPLDSLQGCGPEQQARSWQALPHVECPASARSRAPKDCRVPTPRRPTVGRLSLRAVSKARSSQLAPLRSGSSDRARRLVSRRGSGRSAPNAWQRVTGRFRNRYARTIRNRTMARRVRATRSSRSSAAA